MKRLIVFLLLFLVPSQMGVVVIRRAAGGEGAGLIDCTGAKDWIAQGTGSGGVDHCLFIRDRTWSNAANPDDECGGAATTSSTGLTSGDDAVITGLPSGTPSNDYRLVTTGTEGYVGTIGFDPDNTQDWFISTWLTVDEAAGIADVLGDVNKNSIISFGTGGTDGTCSDSADTTYGCIGFYMANTTNTWSDDDVTAPSTSGYTIGEFVHVIASYTAATDTKRLFRNGLKVAEVGSQAGEDHSIRSFFVGPTIGGIDQSNHETLFILGAITDAEACQLAMCGANGAGGGGANVDEEARATAYGDCQP